MYQLAVKFKYFFIFLIFISFLGCETVREQIFYVEKPDLDNRTSVVQQKRLPGFDVLLNIEQYTIISHKILNAPINLGKVRFIEKWRYLKGNLILMFKAENYKDYYWLAIIPENVANGVMELRAVPRREPGTDLAEIPPPRQFQLLISIRAGKVENHSLVAPQPGWGIFTFFNLEKSIATVKNSDYPECEWKGRWPTIDGPATATMVLITSNCYPK